MAAAEQQTQTKTPTQQKVPEPGQSKGQVATLPPARLPYYTALKDRFGVDQAGWRALIDAVWPTAKTVEAVLLALSYCKSRNLDPFKRPVHIVPIWSSVLRKEIEGVWPGIGELRTTAMRTGLYAGCEPAAFGADVTRTFTGSVKDKSKKDERGNASYTSKTVEVVFPEWCQVTVYRLLSTGERAAVPGPKVYWLETYARAGRTELPNEMWSKRPRGQLEKCAEAAALRRAFPEEIGNEITAEEAAGQTFEAVGPGADTIIDQDADDPPARPKREDFGKGSHAQADDDDPRNEDEPGDDQEEGEAGDDGAGEGLDETWQALLQGHRESLAGCSSLGELAMLDKEWRDYVANPPAGKPPEDYVRQVHALFIEARQRIDRAAGKGRR